MEETESRGPEETRKEAEDNAPVDKKRIALLNGNCGCSTHVKICGQVVDVPVTDQQKMDYWDLLAALPLTQKSNIRPIHDFGMSGVRRARLQFEILKMDGVVADPADLEGAEVIYTSEEFISNDDSFFQQPITKELPPGDYLVRITLRGIDSLRQSVSDLSYIGDSNSLILKKDVSIGIGRLKILPEDSTDWIITSDIDQTFLDTQIDSNQGLIGTMFEVPREKSPIQGMPELYREIQKGEGGPWPLFFISASPHFFRRTLGAVFEHLEISYTGINLKYLANTLNNLFTKTLRSVLNFDEILQEGLSHAIERSMKFLSSSLDSLFDHVAYKLSTLLENRLMQPTGARELLLGDNTESDAFIFTVYQYLISGMIEDAKLEDYLYNLEFLGRGALTRDDAKRISRLVRANIALHGNVNSVKGAWINQAAQEPDETGMLDMIQAALPESADLNKDAQAGHIYKLKFSPGALGFVAAFFQLGLLKDDAFFRVLHRLRGEEYKGRRIDREFIQEVFEHYIESQEERERLLALLP